jgi:hypothetical protein
MSSTLAVDMPNAETETYFLLTIAQIDRLLPFAHPRSIEKGEI